MHGIWRERCSGRDARRSVDEFHVAYVPLLAKAARLVALSSLGFAAGPLAAQTVLLQGTATASYTGSSGPGAPYNTPPGCTVQLAIQVLNGPASPSIPATWSGVFAAAQNPAWPGDGYPLSGTATISGCTNATVQLDDNSNWQLLSTGAGSGEFALSWSGLDGNGNSWWDGPYDYGCRRSMNLPPNANVTASGVSGSYSYSTCYGSAAESVTSTVCLALPGAMNASCSGSSGTAPVLTSVTAIAPQQIQTITLTGSGFGTQNPYNGDSAYLEISDLTGNWNAGWTNNGNANSVTLNVTSWTNTQIVIQGFTGAYGDGNWVLNPGDKVQVSVWNPQSGLGPSSQTVTVGASTASVNPILTSVSPITPQQNQTITLTGSGFGTQNAYNGDSAYLEISDLTGNWNAGWTNNGNPNSITLNVTSWTNTQIVIQGFTGAYGDGNWVLNPGDKVQVFVWNPQSGLGPNSLTVTVAASATGPSGSLLWTLNDAVLQPEFGSPTVTGSFAYNANTAVFSSWSLTVNGAVSPFSSETFTPSNSVVTQGNGPYDFAVMDPTTNQTLILAFCGGVTGTPEPLPATGGTLNLCGVAGGGLDFDSNPPVIDSPFVSGTVTANTANNSANTYYFPHLGLGEGYQTVLTYVNYSTQSVTCQTNFLNDSGGPLGVPFGDVGTVSTRNDNLAPGADIHVETQVPAYGATLSGWAVGTCTGPVKASLLFRLYSGNTAQSEASVNASTTPTTEFVTFAQTATGLAWANPSSQTATVTVNALSSTGAELAGTSFALQPGAHGSANIAPLLNLGSFTGSIQVTSTVPIVSLSLNFEAFPVFSSLPPGDLPPGTPLAGTGGGNSNSSSSTYYFPHLGLGEGYQTVLTYVNYSTQSVTCQTNFLNDSGGPLGVPFGDVGTVSTRNDNLAPGADIHVETQVPAYGATLSGWAVGTCTGPVKASLLFRLYSGNTAQGEASVNASTTPTTEFVTFAQTATGLAWANPSSQTATVTVNALSSTGAELAGTSFALQPGAHGSANIAPLLNLGSFTGSIQVTSTVPIVSLSLNFEAFPVFSSLPPGDLPASTPLAAGTTTQVASPVINIISGNSQTASEGQAFSAPLVVQATDSQGNPLSGEPIAWSVQGNAALSNSSTTTNAEGQVSTTVTAGNSAGTVEITAQAGSAAVQFTLNVTAGGAVSAVVYGTGQNVTNGRDASYQIVSDTTGELTAPAAAYVVTSLAGGWTAISGAAWIGPSADQSNATRNPCCANTSDRYRTTFTVSGNPSNVALNLMIAADDYVDVLLNGNSVFTHPNTAMWGTPVSFSIDSGLVSGTNTLDFLVTNAGGPTGMIVAVSPVISGQPQLTPGQVLTISGGFNTAAGVETTVRFSDNAGYQLVVLPLSVTSGAVTVLVPPYVSGGNLASGSVSEYVIQQPAGGLATTTQPVNVQIGTLPPAGVSPGTITLAVLSQLIQLAANTNNLWNSIASATSGQLNISRLNLPALQTSLTNFQTQIQGLASGSTAQVPLGQVGGQTVYLDAGSLSLIDQLFYSYYLGLASLGNPTATTFESWFAGLIGSIVPATVTSNTHQLRGIASVLIALAEFMAAFSGSTPAHTLGACSWIATVSNSATILEALDGAGNEIFNQQPPDTQDFQTVMDTVSDSTYESQTGSLGNTTSGSPELDPTATTDSDIENAVDPNQPDNITNQTIDFSSLLNAGIDLSGTWTGSYQTPSTACANVTHSGQLTFAITGNTQTGFSGSASINGVEVYETSTCAVEGPADSSSGTVSGTLGPGGMGTASFTLDVSAYPDDYSGTFGFSFTATLSGNTMTGTMTDRTGSFSVTR